jgi:hypothetical protein
MAEKKQSKVKADIKKNRLYITLPSAANKLEMEKIYTDVRFCVADLKPGFDVISDLSQCTVVHLNGLPALRKIMDYLVINQTGRVIRIVGDMSVAFKQFLAISSKFQSYIPVYVTNLEEAEEELLCPIKPNGLRFQINQRQVEYSIDLEEGTGHLVDISTSGCAVQEPTIPLSTDAEISITIPLYQEQDKLSSFTLNAKVVWVRGDRFAVQFHDLDDERKTILYKCLVNEGRIDIA